jgi:uncharacterized membrane protein
MSFHTIERNVGDTERILSAVGGTLLVYMALRRAPLALIFAAIGGYLIQRGSSAHCVIYDALGLTTRSETVSLRAAGQDVERMIDTAVEDSFPASDPPAWNTGSAFTQVDK